jgi:hypothetical protein
MCCRSETNSAGAQIDGTAGRNAGDGAVSHESDGSVNHAIAMPIERPDICEASRERLPFLRWPEGRSDFVEFVAPPAIGAPFAAFAELYRQQA